MHSNSPDPPLHSALLGRTCREDSHSTYSHVRLDADNQLTTSTPQSFTVCSSTFRTTHSNPLNLQLTEGTCISSLPSYWSPAHSPPPPSMVPVQESSFFLKPLYIHLGRDVSSVAGSQTKTNHRQRSQWLVAG